MLAGHDALWFSELQAVFPDDEVLLDYPPIEPLVQLPWDRTTSLIGRASVWTAHDMHQAYSFEVRSPVTLRARSESRVSDVLAFVEQDVQDANTSVLSGILIDSNVLASPIASGLGRQRSRTLPPSLAHATLASLSDDPSRSLDTTLSEASDESDEEDDDAQPTDVPERLSARDKLASMQVDLNADMVVAPRVHVSDMYANLDAGVRQLLQV
jgi:hypothetical protein